MRTNRYLCFVEIQFSKYQGTGNDFVMLNNMNGEYDSLSEKHVQWLCDRKFGIGADGLIKLSSKKGYAFYVDYFNADGSKSFCGNGARCSIAFANFLGLCSVGEVIEFYAIDGIHKGKINPTGVIDLMMADVDGVLTKSDDFIINTGSPHYIRFVEDANELDIVDFGKTIRYSEEYKAEGINVNIIHIKDSETIDVSTYERGVEDETLSCGTGVTACALAFLMKKGTTGAAFTKIRTKGGELNVNCTHFGEGNFKEIWLSGPAQIVFSGSVSVDI